MKGYLQDIKKIAIENHDFRQVLYTAKHCQLVVMALFTIPALTRKPTTNTSTVKRQN